eukprot:13364273-Ditylum_brightwellii.AAC.1
MDINTAKNISGWDDVLDSQIFGGYPPTVEDIITNIKKVSHFAKYLFFSQKHINDEVKLILAAFLLQFYQEFCCLMTNEPQ